MDLMELESAIPAFKLASVLVYREPEPATFAAFIEEDLFEEVPYGQGDEAVSEGVALMRAWCQNHSGISTDQFSSAMQTLKSDWFMLFVGPGVPKAPSWAGYYLSIRSELLSQVTLDVRRLYRAWGFEPDGKKTEPDDNLGVLLGFFAELLLLEMKQVESSGEVILAQQEVLQRYILPWLPAWRWSVAKYAKTDFFRGVGEMVFGLCRVCASRFGFVYVEDGQHSRFCLEKD